LRSCAGEKQHVSPFEIKKKGLTEKLTSEELMIALYHYLKYRGYKSNRKIDGGDESDKKILSGILPFEKSN
jgi:CRISPR/Cas system Type II protein with McrA/HNH and RuvC-like nuclease domain